MFFSGLVQKKGVSLAETLAALTIGSMVLVAVFGLCHRARRSASVVIDRIEDRNLPSEVLQRIAEDMDRVIEFSSDTKILMENKHVKGLASARLEIVRTIYNDANETEIFERTVWQSYPSVGGDRLTLYRSHSGLAMEDKLLDEHKEKWRRELFVPICDNISFFQIQAIRDDFIYDRWTNESILPYGIEVTVSFAEPYKKVDGTFDVAEDQKYVRTIAVDRTRKIKFRLAPSKTEEAADE